MINLRNDSVNGAEEINGDISKQMNLDDETDIEGVSDTVFDDKADSLRHEHTQNLSPNEKENSSDPFNLYNLLNKRDKGEANSGLDSSIPFPPGFTLEREFQHVDAQDGQGMENSLSKRRSEGLSSRVLEDAQPLNKHASPSIDSKKKADGSILEVIDDMIKVGQSMGFTMEGCMNDMEKIIGSQGAHDRWVDLNGEGVFRVKDVRILLDECFLPKAPTATQWVKYVPIKINVFAWKVFLDRLPTRSNLQHRGVQFSDLLFRIAPLHRKIPPALVLQFAEWLRYRQLVCRCRGKTIPNVDVCLPDSVFSHGQLYVALSRGIPRATTKVLVKPEKEFGQEGVYTSNVVYQEVLRDE
ncbi:RNA-directed DNA polymerase, eukaryota [Tanacetum coccineum]